MAFDISLQINNSEPERVYKMLSPILTVSGELKSETSLIDPIIIIECDMKEVVNCNYMTIPVFKRSYFVNNIRSIRSGLVEFSCHCDVLSSFAEQILENTAIIRRQQEQWNLYLNDGSFKVYQNPIVLTKAFPAGFTTQEIVLAVAGK